MKKGWVWFLGLGGLLAPVMAPGYAVYVLTLEVFAFERSHALTG